MHDDDRDNSDYAADNSSDHSSSTPFESPRHRSTALTDSPLAKPRLMNNYNENNNKNDFSTKTSTAAKIECEPSTSGYNPNQQSTYDVINVFTSIN